MVKVTCVTNIIHCINHNPFRGGVGVPTPRTPPASATAGPSQLSVSPNSRPIADAESAEQQIVSKLVPQVSTIAGLNGKGNSSFAWLFFCLGQDLPSKVGREMMMQNGKQCMTAYKYLLQVLHYL